MNITKIYQRLENFTAQQLYEKSATYHRTCYASCTNIKTISQVQKRFSDSLQSKNLQTKASIGRPSGKRKIEEESDLQSSVKRLRSSSGGKFDKSKCIVCQEYRPESLHKVEYLEMGTKMLNVAKELTNKTLFIRLNSARNAEDGPAADVQYHRTCWIKTTRQMAKDQRIRVDNEETNNEMANIIADIEF